MPRRQDPELEGEILDAAQKLWKKGGEKALTMRTVAKAARTNTPAVYRRFRNREDILRGLLERVRMEFNELMKGAATPGQAGELYLDFALSHPREYELFYQYEYKLYYSERSNYRGKMPGRPAAELMKRKLAEELGGSPDDHKQLTLALWMLAHGAAMLIIGKTVLPGDVEAARAVFSKSVKALLSGARRR
jgi:AcrR family transcriptional regulator